MDLSSVLARFRDDVAHWSRGDRLCVAFSGGPDSTALLLALAEAAPAWGLDLVAAHLDHAEDPGSASRARRAGELAAELGVPLVSARRPADDGAPRGAEDAARRRRYRFLEEVRRRHGARHVLTAHHRDDQVETVLLRLLFGSGPFGLAGIPTRRGPLLRPLLEVPGRTLRRRVAEAGLSAVDDPTNRDPGVPRNRVRALLLPELRRRDPRIDLRLLDLAAAAAAAAHRLDRALGRGLDVRRVAGGAALDAAAVEALPAPLLAPALSLLARAAGARYPPAAGPRRELARQMRAQTGLGIDCGAGWRLEARDGRLRLHREEPGTASPPVPFAYTVRAPGRLRIEELGRRLHIERGPVASWMFRSAPDRAGLALPIEEGAVLTVRGRRPGDRIRPLGCPHRRRLKEVLIDRKVPRRQRDRLPLLCVGGRIAWVPGVTIDDAYRLDPSHRTAWIVHLSRT